MNTAPQQIRQGAVLLVPVIKLPDGCTPVEPNASHQLILAQGETAGHVHTVDAMAPGGQRCAFLWLAPDGEWYLQVLKSAPLRHPAHDSITVAVGIYTLPVQVEADPDDGIAWVLAD